MPIQEASAARGGASPGARPVAGDCLAKAVALLGRREHLSAELAAKLLKRGFETDQVERAIATLSGQGYLDDRRVAADWARRQVERRSWGAARLKAELGRRAVAEDIVAEVVAEVCDEPEAAARRAAERWRARHGDGGGDALARHLARLGHAPRGIVAALTGSADESHDS